MGNMRAAQVVTSVLVVGYALTCPTGWGASKSAKLLKEEAELFTIPTRTEDKAEFLKHWERKFRVKFYAYAADVPDQGKLMRRVVAYMKVYNKSPWPLNFKANRGAAKELGVIPAKGKSKKTLVYNFYEQRNVTTNMAGGYMITTAIWREGSVAFKVKSSTGKQVSLAIRFKLDIQTPKPNPKVWLDLGPERKAKRKRPKRKR